jgi:hypothetical protein
LIGGEQTKRLVVGRKQAEVALVERQDVLDLVARGEDDDRGVREADRQISVAFDDRDRGSYVGRRERFEVSAPRCTSPSRLMRAARPTRLARR